MHKYFGDRAPSSGGNDNVDVAKNVENNVINDTQAHGAEFNGIEASESRLVAMVHAVLLVARMDLIVS